MAEGEDRPAREPPPRFLPGGWDQDAPAPRFSMGKRVRLGQAAPEALGGLHGVVERVAGHFSPDPGAAKAPLYRVRVALGDLWGAEAEGFEAADTLDLEVFDPGLEPFFNYSDFAAEKTRLEAALLSPALFDQPARLDALAALARRAPTEQEMALPKDGDAHSLLLHAALGATLLKEALLRPRAILDRLGAPDVDPNRPLRLHLASGRISYRLVDA